MFDLLMRSLTVERCASIQRFVRATLARLTVCATFVLTLSALPSAAQVGPRTDVIRGRVTGPDTVPVLGAQVVAVDTVSKVQRPTRTDARGAFAIAFENGNGTYMVGVNMLGFAPQRRVVSRLPDGSMPVVEFKLSQVAAQLGAVRSVGERPRAVRSDVGGDFSVGGQTSFVNPNNGLTGDLTGDLTLALTTIPGVTLIPSATGGLPTVSAFGITGDQNGMQDTRQDIGNGVGGICGATAVIATFGDTCSYDFIQFPDDALPISIAGLELGLHRHQDHFKDVGVLLDIL